VTRKKIGLYVILSCRNNIKRGRKDGYMKFGERRICYNNFAGHLLNSYNPNVLYPSLRINVWNHQDWENWIRMIASFGFNVYEFWLEPFFFCREGISSAAGCSFIKTINEICKMAHDNGVKVEMIAALATTGAKWKTLCPNVKSEWEEIRFLWNEWTKALSELDIVGIFPGDPGGCSINGCTAETYIDKSIDIAVLVEKNIPAAEVEFHTWGPPFFGWGIIENVPGRENEYIPACQASAWKFSRSRMEKSMNYLLKRLPDFPDKTSVAINMGFTPDGNPDGDNNAIPWAREIAKTRTILTWDFSLTEGENAIIPHYRFKRLFEQRRMERMSAPYSGGVCFTMTPKLNQLSLYESAVSFKNPDADPDVMAQNFYEMLFGADGRKIASYLPLFEVIPDWGNYAKSVYEQKSFHKAMVELKELLISLRGHEREVFFIPTAVEYREELLWYADWFAKASSVSPDYDMLAKEYWNRVYAIYDKLPPHVDPRPEMATRRIVDFFKKGGSL